MWLTCLAAAPQFPLCVPRDCRMAGAPSGFSVNSSQMSPTARGTQRAPQDLSMTGPGPTGLHNLAESAESHAPSPTLCLPLSMEDSHQVATKNTPRPVVTEASRQRGERRPQLTSLFTTPTPIFSSPQKAQLISQ